MNNKDQILTEIFFNDPADAAPVAELSHDHNVYNKLMQINLLKENFDIDYETGYFNDSVN